MKCFVTFALFAFGAIGLCGPAQAADEKTNSFVDTYEYGPERKTGKYLSCTAFRIQKSGQAAEYGVSVFSGIIRLADAEALLKFHGHYKDKKKSDAKEIASASVRWTCKTRDGVSMSFILNLGSGAWSSPNLGALDASFFTDLAAAITDAKAMQKVPFSVSP